MAKRGDIYCEVRNPRMAPAGHVEYEVCLLVKQGERLTATDQIKWSVFHRYSEFEAFDKALRERFGWQVQGIKLPPKKTFGSKSPDFVEKRRGALQAYLREVMAVSRITDFHTHFGFKGLADFINWEGRSHGMKQEGPPGASPPASDAAASDAAAAAPAPARSARRSRRASRRAPRAMTAGLPSQSAVRTGVAAAPKLSAPASDLPIAGSGSGAGAGSAAPAAAPAAASSSASASTPPARAAAAPTARARAPARTPAAAAPAAAPAPAPAALKAALPPAQPGRAGLLADIRKRRKE